MCRAGFFGLALLAALGAQSVSAVALSYSTDVGGLTFEQTRGIPVTYRATFIPRLTAGQCQP